MAGIGDVPREGLVSDVFVIVNAISPADHGCLVDYDTDDGDPGICNTSFQAGENVSDSDLVQVSASGYITVANHSNGTVDVAVTVMGYYQALSGQSAGDTYVSLPETPIVDTRSGLGAPNAMIPGGGTLTVQISGQGGIPAGADAAALFIGADDASATGDISAYPAGGTGSGLSVLSYSPGRILRDYYAGALSPAGRLTLVNNGSNPVDLIVDATGYLASPASAQAGSTYTGLAPSRVLDTRTTTPVPAGESVTFAATGVDDVPTDGVVSVAESVAALNATSTGWLSVYSADGPASGPVVNFNSGDTQDNDLSTPLVSSVSSSGEETVTNHSSGTVDVVVSLRGYFTAPTAPAAPDSVSASVSGGTATITWQTPLSDGGSPITGYTVSASPDNATVSVDSGTHQATLSGLANPSADTFAVTAANAEGTSAGAQPLNGAETASFAEDIDVVVDPSTDTLTVTGVTSTYSTTDTHGATTVIPEPPDDVTDSDASFTHGQACDPRKVDGITVTTHPPFNSFKSHTSFATQWLNHLFSVKNGRKVGSQWQYEGLLCTAGGANTWNGYALSLAEDSIFTESTDTNTMWNYNFGVKITSATQITRSLGFNLQNPAQTASISGGESVSLHAPNAELNGGLGPDGHWGGSWPSKYNPYDGTRVNGEWEADNDSGLSLSFEGNTALGLYLYPMGSGPHHYHSLHLTHAVCLLSLEVKGANCPNPLY